jgi:ABC-type transport system substrate-binding protein
MTEGHATQDLNVRKAIDLALNFDGLAQIGTGGAYGASTGYVEEGLEYHLDTYTAEERAVDIEAAKALLEEAGYGDGLELTTVYMGEIKTVLEAAQYMLQQIGINLTLNSVDTGAFVQAANGGDYDIIFIGEWLPNRLASSFPFIRWDNIHGFHMGGPQTTTDELDGLVHDFIKADDNEAAKEILAQIEQIMKDDCMQSNMYPEVKSIIMNKDLKGFATRERGYLDATSCYK